MDERAADALVIFGASGDLCARKIFPALYHLTRRGRLKVPVIGVARAGWTREQFIAHVHESLKTFVKTTEAAVMERLGGAAAVRRWRLPQGGDLRVVAARRWARRSNRFFTSRFRPACFRS